MTERDVGHSAEKDVVGYALQIAVNAFSPSAYWKFDEEYGPVRETLYDAFADREEALDLGYHGEHLRIVALTVVAPVERRTEGSE